MPARGPVPRQAAPSGSWSYAGTGGWASGRASQGWEYIPAGSARAVAPISRPAPLVGNRENLRALLGKSIDHAERKPLKNETAGSVEVARPALRRLLDQLECLAQLPKEILSRLEAPFLIPAGCGVRFGDGSFGKSQRRPAAQSCLRNRRASTSSQPRRRSSPESTASIRRRISSAQAASTPSSISESRLSISLDAMAARSTSERSRTCLRSSSALAVILVMRV